ncbi:MAG: alpha/beta hydrolase-fold protein [Chitinophagaceae bacterium]
MIKIAFAIFSLFYTSILMAQQSVRMEIKTLPEYHPSGSEIYLAGSFNGWNPHDEKYKFQQDNSGNYYYDLNLAEGFYDYKVTRGGWDKSECKKGGTGSGNRVVKIPSITSVAITIEEWMDRYPAKPKISTASKNVHIIDTAFLVPQLKRTRRIWVYLPDGYEKTEKKYPVLYLQDGQNIFDDATSYSGEWGVDDYLDSISFGQCIVVAIDHGGEKRMNEYNPYDNKRFGKGEGKKYIEFLAKTLKPFIDKKYRTVKDREHTFIAGSSMGGLISMYAVLTCPKVFGGAGIFSPSFWITGSKIYDDIKKKGKKVNSSIYFYAGKQEDESMVPNLLKAFERMSAVSKSRMVSMIRDEGMHNEGRWRVEFPLFYQWIFPGEL